MVGEKNAPLDKMYRELAANGVRVPNDFAGTAEAYRSFLREAGLDKKLQEILKDLDKGKLENLRERGLLIRHAIVSTSLLLDLEQSFSKTYDYLSSASDGPVDLVVHSSATAENLPDASFAGQ